MRTCLGSGVRSCELGLRNLFMYLVKENMSMMERVKVRKRRKNMRLDVYGSLGDKGKGDKGM